MPITTPKNTPSNTEFIKAENTAGNIAPRIIIKNIAVIHPGISCFAISLGSPKSEI